MIQSNGWRIPYCADLHVCYSITVMSFKLNIAWKARWKTPDEHCPKLFSVTHFMIIWLLEDWFRYIRDIKQFTFLWLHVFFWKIGQCKEPTNFIAFLGLNIDSSVIRQKGESQNGGLKKTKYIKYSEKRTYLTTWYAHVRVGIMGYEMFIFRKIWCALFSWNTHFEIRPFALLPTNSEASNIFNQSTKWMKNTFWKTCWKSNTRHSNIGTVTAYFRPVLTFLYSLKTSEIRFLLLTSNRYFYEQVYSWQYRIKLIK